MKARARCELKQLCCNCYINPDFSVKMSDVTENSEFCYPGKKREKRGGHMIKCLLTELGRAGQENIWPSHSVNKYILSYDQYGPARAFIAKLLRKSPYEGRTRWREQGRKKPSGPARIAYGPHTGIFSIVLQ